MPLDTGGVTQNVFMSANVDMGDAVDHAGVDIDGAPNIGAALRSTRLGLGRTLQDVSDATRIKRAYLEALEEMRLEDLPSRPFTIGYVRAYARVLGLDPDTAVARFKDDAPSDIEPLRAPVGVRKHSDVRLSLLFGGGALVITAVLVWNVAQHAMKDESPPPPVVAPEAPAPSATAAPTTVSVSAAQPAPVESTLPPPYQTPGLNPSSAPADAASAAAADPQDPPTFIAHGQIYGATAQASQVLLQARKSVSLVVRRPDGSVFFAQELKAGEAYRPPMTGNLSIDVPAFQDVRVYAAGQLHAPLAGETTAVAKLTPPPAPVASAAPSSGAPQAASAAAPPLNGAQASTAPKAPAAARPATAPKAATPKPAIASSAGEP
jgi:cytoskeletal protein RodZ